MNKFQKVALKCARDNIQTFSKWESEWDLKTLKNSELSFMKRKGMTIKDAYEYKEWNKNFMKRGCENERD